MLGKGDEDKLVMKNQLIEKCLLITFVSQKRCYKSLNGNGNQSISKDAAKLLLMRAT